MNLRLIRRSGLGVCANCGGQTCGADPQADECIACQIAGAAALQPVRVIPVHAEAIVDAWIRGR